MSGVLARAACPDLTGKVVIVTGASRGIGATAARAFARAGAIVVLAARNEQALSSIVQAIRADGGQARAVTADVADASAVERLVQDTANTHGRLDAAFNNAAATGQAPVPLADVRVEDFDAALQTTLRGTFLCMKYEIPVMLANGGGAILNMSSTAGLRGVRGIGAYVATKHGVIGLTKTAALDYADRGIRVNAIAPGPILNDRLAAAPDNVRESVAGAVPMRRIGRPEEVAAAAVWLCSDQASFVTGAVLTIDGGRLSGGG